MSDFCAKYRAILLSLAAVIVLIASILLAASWLAKAPYPGDHVFGTVRSGELGNNKARYIDDWYVVEVLDDGTYIIGESKSSQYNVAYLLVGTSALC